MKLNRPKYKDIEAEAFGDIPASMDIIQLKYDGWWGQLVLDGMDWKLYSRTGQLKRSGLLTTPWERTVIHGEFCYGTQWSKQRDEFYGKLFAFDTTEVEGIDTTILPWKERNLALAAVVERARQEPMFRSDEGLRAVVRAYSYRRDDLQDVWERFVVNGPEYEGLVFKDSSARWGGGFARMKKMVSLEYVCMGFESSDSDRHAGWGVASVLGGLYVDGVLKQVCKVSGLADDQRRAFYSRPTEFVGKVFEANGKMLMKSGALRHPNFVKWRPDKRAEECQMRATEEQDDG